MPSPSKGESELYRRARVGTGKRRGRRVRLRDTRQLEHMYPDIFDIFTVCLQSQFKIRVKMNSSNDLLLYLEDYFGACVISVIRISSIGTNTDSHL